MPDDAVTDRRSESLTLHVVGLDVRALDGRRLLDIPTLAVAAGERLCITGPSGAGKSTLLMSLAGLLEPKAGSVRWNDLDLVGQTRARRAAFRQACVGLVFQDYLLFEELGALDNAALADAWDPRPQRPPARARRERAAELLTRLGIDPYSVRSVMQHSGGERQRIAVARALASSPRIVLADEPTASLDRDSADRLIDDLLHLVQQQSQTLIVVSHDPVLRGACDRVVTLRDGRVHSDRLTSGSDALAADG